MRIKNDPEVLLFLHCAIKTTGGSKTHIITPGSPVGKFRFESTE